MARSNTTQSVHRDRWSDGILRLQRSGILASANLSETSFWSPHFQRYILLLSLRPSAVRRGKSLSKDWTECPNFFQTQEHCQVRRGPRGSRLGHLRRFLCLRYVYYYVAVVPVGQKLLL